MPEGTPQELTERLLERMEEIAPMRPDIVCLPELASFRNLGGGRSAVERVAEQPPGPFSSRFAEFARKNGCYVFCGLYTQEEGRLYNSMVLLDRQGKPVGEYRKIHPTEGEIEKGIVPGPSNPPVFRTDFGVVGGQICFDIEWQEGWMALQKAGAEIVFWPSAFGGGQKLNMLANLNRYVIVSSTQKGVSKVCDISGETVAWTGLWERTLCVPVNLEKAFIHSWPYSDRFGAIRKKYGQAVRIVTFHDEEWTIIESRAAEVKVADILKEFEIRTYEEMIKNAEAARSRALG
jgi:predicted amidohydrolase